jgi:hypothetical protein
MVMGYAPGDKCAKDGMFATRDGCVIGAASASPAEELR